MLTFVILDSRSPRCCVSLDTLEYIDEPACVQRMDTGNISVATFVPYGGVDMEDPAFVVDFSSLVNQVVFIETSLLKLN